MSIIYRAAFRLGADESPATVPLGDVAERCLHWVFDRRSPRVQRPSQLAAGELADLETCEIGDGTTLATAAAESDGQHLWGMRFEHPDRDSDHVRWRTDLIARCDEGVGSTHFACVQSRVARTDRIEPLVAARSRPRIVETILSKHGGRAAHSLDAVPRLVRESNATDLLTLLLDPSRCRPLVFVSARTVDDRTVADGDALASWLCGLAHVYVAENRFPSLRLKDDLPERLQCWDGAVRVYWPGFRRSDDRFRHPFWSARRIREIEAKRSGGFREHVLQRIADASAMAMGDPLDSWDGLLALRRRQLMRDARSEGRDDAYIELADKTISGLEEAKVELERELAAAREEARKNRGEADSWRVAYEAERRGEHVEDDSAELVPIGDVAAAVDRAEQRFPEQLVFTLNSTSDVEANPFESPEDVWTALEWLATTYYEARTGVASVPDFDLSLRDVCGWKYKAHQSDVTMKKYKRWYTTKVDGQTVWLHEHMGTGSGKDARYTIRVGFDWDPKQKVVVIGFIGQHQQTDAT